MGWKHEWQNKWLSENDFFQNINLIMSHPCFKSPLTSSNLACASKALDYWASHSSAASSPTTLPQVLCIPAILTFLQALDPAELSLNSGHLPELFLLLGLLFICLHIPSSGKSSWVGPDHTLSLCSPHRWLPCIVCELQVSGTGPTLFTDLSPRPSIQLLNEWLNAVPVGHLENSPYLEHDSGL